jgi:hypothetical protein
MELLNVDGDANIFDISEINLAENSIEDHAAMGMSGLVIVNLFRRRQ